MKLIFLLFFFISTIISAQNPYSVNTAIIKDSIPDDRTEFSKQFGFIPYLQWKEGMKFIVVPTNYDEELDISPYVDEKSYAPLIKVKDWEYKLFYFKKFDTKISNGHTCAILESEGRYFIYRPYFSSDFLKEKGRQADHLIYMRRMAYANDIDTAKKLLVGKHVFILIKTWLQKTESGDRLMQSGSVKYVPVTVTQIGLGSADCPVRVVFKDEQNTEAFVDVYISGINSSETGSAFEQSFDKTFSLNNPKNLHPKITKETWSLIENEKVKIGMTEEELFLSWGKPEKINSTIVGGKEKNQYVYHDQYVYIDDGKISAMQNSK